MFIIMGGYTSGIKHKTAHSCDGVITLYVLNLLLVAISMGCYFYFSRSSRTHNIVFAGDSIVY